MFPHGAIASITAIVAVGKVFLRRYGGKKGAFYSPKRESA